MSLFQNQVERQYLAGITTDLSVIYQNYISYFGNPDIQSNILQVTEESYQGEFIRALFVDLLGYTAQPHPDFNIVREKKNETDSKSADAAIIVDKLIVAVIELKDHKTQDLKKVEIQAFGYKNNHKNCRYVITSNFEKLRFYIDNAVEFIEFELFKLSYEEFQRLWLCLSYESISRNLPLEIKKQSISSEENITKEFYNDYTACKRQLFDNIVTLNPYIDKLLLFRSTQKLLDRFLFLFFAEDKGLLPANSVQGTIGKWEKYQSDPMNEYQSLYSRFIRYFRLLDTGYKDANIEIYAYNGGLFAEDKHLNSLLIDDLVLQTNISNLARFDYNTDVDVNILGHIFENSLNEIEEVANELSNATKSTSKRKQDGVYYTPRYITKYIVESTIGRLCENKKTALGIGEALFEYKRTDKKKEALRIFDDYRNWLLHLTIVDPACGSGAFLNMALEYLIAEHKWIDNQQDKITGLAGHYSMGLPNIENDILENNLFGVDINDESVEIARLSLWLRTAKPNRKLNSLNKNIKCGNSLIDNPALGGDKAFNWQQEFPQVFQKKSNRAWHITTATHNSRYSQRMSDYRVTTGDPVWLTGQDELIISRTIAEIAEQDQLKILAYNICGDHLHLALVCEEEELPAIVGKLKSMSSRAANIAAGRTVTQGQVVTQGHVVTRGHAPVPDTITRGHAPVSDADAPEHIYDTTERIPEEAQGHAPVHIYDAPVSDSRGETQYKIWTQKYGCKEITSGEQLLNTIAYIENNRTKHGLPPLDKHVYPRTVSIADAYRTEYKGGFDVVIGNPPYVQLQSMGEMSDVLKNCGYETFDKGADLYCLFTERGYKLLKSGGVQSFIMPNKWMLVAYGKPLRKFLAHTGLRQVLNFGDVQFFDEAATIVCIFVTQNDDPAENVKVLSLNKKTYHGDFITEVSANVYDYPATKFGENEWSIQPLKDAVRLEKMKLNGTELKDLPININYGIKTGFNDAFFIDAEKRQQLIAEDPKSAALIKPMVRGRDIIPYGISGYEYLIGTLPSLKLDIENYPAIKKHLLSFGYDRLKQTGEQGSRKKTNGKWFETQDSINYYQEFEKPKIIYPNMTSVFPFMYDESGMLGNQKCFIITSKSNSISLLYLTAVLNSSLTKLWIWYNCPELLGGTREISKVYFEHFPVPSANEAQTQKLEQLAEFRIQASNQLQSHNNKFLRLVQRKFDLENLPGTIQQWNNLTFKEFLKELGKKKVKLSLAQETEWEEHFLLEQQKARSTQDQIDATDKEIDRIVSALYGISDADIAMTNI